VTSDVIHVQRQTIKATFKQMSALTTGIYRNPMKVNLMCDKADSLIQH